ncbi:hypothetical protein F0562_030255 [Nyssa sinensis]|uniref:Uncharacterized protein n=1 Tax=Nyssa sinensis TaxID=561372 RepID=A0A5J5B019_9ASTE|nr:hypothetical protein F0562_030255 [Nyssa sinensis]
MASNFTLIVNSSSSEQRWVHHMSRMFQNDLIIDIIADGIFEVPESIRAFKPEAYSPQLLALGPYHQFRPELYEMQWSKLAAAKGVLNRHRNLNFEQLVNWLKQMGPEIRMLYNKYLDLDPDSLAWILAIDGLFLIHFILTDMNNQDHFGKFKIDSIISDIMMLENQIPAFLLRAITMILSFQPVDGDGTAVPTSSGEPMVDQLFPKLINFCKTHSPLELEEYSSSLCANPLHLLDLMYHLIVNKGARREGEVMTRRVTRSVREQATQVLGNVEQIMVVAEDLGLPGVNVIKKPFTIIQKFFALVKQEGNNSGTEGETPKVEEIKIPKVSQLYKVANIKFLPTPEGRGIRYIDLIQTSEKEFTFYLPVITLNVNSEVILRNLVAYEVLSAKPRSTLEFAQYVDLMSGIIDDAEDVRLLREVDIIKGSLTDEEVASLFNRINKVDGKPEGQKSEPEKTIDKVNDTSDFKPEAYTPQLIDLGPYHHFQPELYEMQWSKLAAAKGVVKPHQTKLI